MLFFFKAASSSVSTFHLFSLLLRPSTKQLGLSSYLSGEFNALPLALLLYSVPLTNFNTFPALLRANADYLLYYEAIAGNVLTYAIPLAVLCILNFQVSNEIRRSKESKKHLTSQTVKEHKTAQMMLYVVLCKALVST